MAEGTSNNRPPWQTQGQASHPRPPMPTGPPLGARPPPPRAPPLGHRPPPPTDCPPLPPPRPVVPSEESPKPPEDDTETEKDGVSSEAGRKKAEKAPVGKIKMGFGVLGKRPASAGGISMKIKPQVDLTAKKPKTDVAPQQQQSKPASKLVAQAFGSDSEEEEEMPPEARLRMRNIGKDTPTSSGPNSFYKTAKGFTDPRGSWRNELEND